MSIFDWIMKTTWAVLLFVGMVRRDPYLMAFAATFLVCITIEEAS